mmetsp:Transcript_7085/g.15122  ORF Transcript_7085/g.15122 Transcript_7085/m.15122 type:complete len:229 (+) Transcript_7085:100-786(+)
MRVPVSCALCLACAADVLGPTVELVRDITGVDESVADGAVRAAVRSLHEKTQADALGRDFSAPCPKGWVERHSASSMACEAPSAYQGPCSGVMKMGGLSVVGKMDLQTACEVEWPRVDSLVPKSDLLDPKGHHGVAFLGTAVGEECSRARGGAMAAVQGADKVARGLGNVALKVCGCADEKSSFCPQWSPAVGCAVSVQAFQAAAAHAGNLWQAVQATSRLCSYVGAF